MSVPRWLIELLSTGTNPGKDEAIKMLLEKNFSQTFPPGFTYPGPTTGQFSEHPHGGRGRSGYGAGRDLKADEQGTGEANMAPDSGGGNADDADTAMNDMVARILKAGRY